MTTQGLPSWAYARKTSFTSPKDNAVTKDAGYIVYGEWCGPGIQKSVAVSAIPNKIFAVFAAKPLQEGNDNLLIDPQDLEELVRNVEGAYVLPWHKDSTGASVSLEIDWTAADEHLEHDVKFINAHVNAVEENDPWVDETFGVKGTGEGLVFYPCSDEHLGVINFNNLVFKAKGEKHRVIKAKEAAQVNPDVAASVDQFVDMVLAEARLEQGAGVVGETNGLTRYENRLVGNFIKWITADVQKETKDEMEAAGLTWEQVSKAVTAKARAWYLDKSK